MLTDLSDVKSAETELKKYGSEASIALAMSENERKLIIH